MKAKAMLRRLKSRSLSQFLSGYSVMCCLSVYSSLDLQIQFTYISFCVCFCLDVWTIWEKRLFAGGGVCISPKIVDCLFKPINTEQNKSLTKENSESRSWVLAFKSKKKKKISMNLNPLILTCSSVAFLLILSLRVSVFTVLLQWPKIQFQLNWIQAFLNLKRYTKKKKNRKNFEMSFLLLFFSINCSLGCCFFFYRTLFFEFRSI